MRFRILLSLVALLAAAAEAPAKKRPIPVKVVVVTMFERGADTGDQPGELGYLVTVRDAVVVWFNSPFTPLIVSA